MTNMDTAVKHAVFFVDDPGMDASLCIGQTDQALGLLRSFLDELGDGEALTIGCRYMTQEEVDALPMLDA